MATCGDARGVWQHCGFPAVPITYHLPEQLFIISLLVNLGIYLKKKQFSSGCVSICCADRSRVLRAADPFLIGHEKKLKWPSTSRVWLRGVYMEHTDVECDHLSNMFKLYAE